MFVITNCKYKRTMTQEPKGAGDTGEEVERKLSDAQLRVIEERRRNPFLKGNWKNLEEYEIKDVIGCGGFGITYKAWDSELNDFVAIKENFPRACAHRSRPMAKKVESNGNQRGFDSALKSFQKEARMLRDLEKLCKENGEQLPPSIIKVFRLFRKNGTAYMVMEFIEGDSFAELIKERHDEGDLFSQLELMEICVPICEALELMHRHGSYHRDIKPANIMVQRKRDSETGVTKLRPVLIDFGAARYSTGQETQDLTLFKSYGFTPIELQQKNGNIGAWSDIYSFAAALYNAIVGEAPPDVNERQPDDAIICLAETFASEEGEEGGYTRQFLAAIDKALHFVPDKRPQSVIEWLNDLSGIEVVEENVDKVNQDEIDTVKLIKKDDVLTGDGGKEEGKWVLVEDEDRADEKEEAIEPDEVKMEPEDIVVLHSATKEWEKKKQKGDTAKGGGPLGFGQVMKKSGYQGGDSELGSTKHPSTVVKSGATKTVPDEGKAPTVNVVPPEKKEDSGFGDPLHKDESAGPPKKTPSSSPAVKRVPPQKQKSSRGLVAGLSSVSFVSIAACLWFLFFQGDPPEAHPIEFAYETTEYTANLSSTGPVLKFEMWEGFVTRWGGQELPVDAREWLKKGEMALHESVQGLEEQIQSDYNDALELAQHSFSNWAKVDCWEKFGEDPYGSMDEKSGLSSASIQYLEDGRDRYEIAVLNRDFEDTFMGVKKEAESAESYEKQIEIWDAFLIAASSEDLTEDNLGRLNDARAALEKAKLSEINDSFLIAYEAAQEKAMKAVSKVEAVSIWEDLVDGIRREEEFYPSNKALLDEAKNTIEDLKATIVNDSFESRYLATKDRAAKATSRQAEREIWELFLNSVEDEEELDAGRKALLEEARSAVNAKVFSESDVEDYIRTVETGTFGIRDDDKTYRFLKYEGRPSIEQGDAPDTWKVTYSFTVVTEDEYREYSAILRRNDRIVEVVDDRLQVRPNSGTFVLVSSSSKYHSEERVISNLEPEIRKLIGTFLTTNEAPEWPESRSRIYAEKVDYLNDGIQTRQQLQSTFNWWRGAMRHRYDYWNLKKVVSITFSRKEGYFTVVFETEFKSTSKKTPYQAEITLKLRDENGALKIFDEKNREI